MKSNHRHLPRPVSYHELQRQISLLVNVNRGETCFISCYLNLRQTDNLCNSFLDTRFREIRECLCPEEQADFDEASERIRSGLESSPSQAAGLALFAGGARGGQFFLSVPLAVPVENRLSYYPVPDVYPLVELGERYGCFLLVFAGQNGMQLLDVSMGTASVQAWSALPPAISSIDPHSWRDNGKRPHTLRFRLDKPIRSLQLHLRNSGHQQLLLAGVPAVNELLMQQLPASVLSRLVDRVPLKAGATEGTAVASALTVYKRSQERSARKIADHIVQDIHGPGSRVKGICSSLEALRTGTADRLIMIKGFGQASPWYCRHCGENRTFGRQPGCCPFCGRSKLGPLETRAEMMRLASRQGIPITLVPPDHDLRYMGGVACLLHQRVADSADRAGRLKLAA